LDSEPKNDKAPKKLVENIYSVNPVVNIQPEIFVEEQQSF
jgi:hypothetical protein